MTLFLIYNLKITIDGSYNFLFISRIQVTY